MEDIVKVAKDFTQSSREASSSAASVRYIEHPYPAKLDEFAERLVEAYVVASQEERALARQCLADTAASNGLVCFAVRAATQAVRRGSPEILFQGLMALIIENGRDDYRETVMAWSVILNAAVRIHADPVGLYQRAIAHATPRMAEGLTSLIENYKRSLNSSLMGYRYEITQDGFTYY